MPKRCPSFFLYFCGKDKHMAIHKIDYVRDVVLTALNKENRGFLTPEQFNLYAKNAQQEIFSLYGAEHAKLVGLKNARRLSADHGDRVKQLEDLLDGFVKTGSISQSGGVYPKPSDMQYPLYLKYGGVEAQKVKGAKMIYLSMSNLTAPSASYPVYVDSESGYTLMPYTSTQSLDLVYVRELADPKWTYQVIGEDPVFNPSAADYQDFELPLDETPKLIITILKYAGLTVRDVDVVNAAGSMDAVLTQKES